MENWMIYNSVVLWIAVIVNFIITLALVRRLTELLELAKDNQRPEMIKVGEKAPDMEIIDLNGDVSTQANFIGQSVAIVFVSPNCNPCRNAMPQLEDAYYKAKSNDVALLIVNMVDIEETRVFVDELNIQVPVYALPVDSPLGNDFRIIATPSYYLLGKNWHVKAGGSLDAEWRQLVNTWAKIEISVSTLA